MSGYSIRSRSPGSFNIRYRLKGKTVDITYHCDTKTEADREARRLVHLVDEGQHPANTRETTGAWLERWLNIIRPDVRPITYDGYSRIVRTHLIPRLGAVPLGKLAKAHIQELQSGLAQEGKAASTRRLVHRVLSASLTCALELDEIGRNPCDALRRRLPKIPKKDIVPLTAAQTREVLQATADSRYGLAFLLGLSTGARRAEICGLRWRNVDLERGQIRITETLTEVGGELFTGGTKNARPRPVSLPTTAIETLRRAYKEQAEISLALGTPIRPDSLVCAAPDGSPMRPRALTGYAARMFKRLGIPTNFHGTRHAHASSLLLAGVHPKAVQERLGHSSITVTLDVYSHLIKALDDDAAEKIDIVLRG